jgi:hypothetical protein
LSWSVTGWHSPSQSIGWSNMVLTIMLWLGMSHNWTPSGQCTLDHKKFHIKCHLEFMQLLSCWLSQLEYICVSQLSMQVQIWELNSASLWEVMGRASGQTHRFTFYLGHNLSATLQIWLFLIPKGIRFPDIVFWMHDLPHAYFFLVGHFTAFSFHHTTISSSSVATTTFKKGL